MTRLSRRSALRLGAGGLAAGLAGCLDVLGADERTPVREEGGNESGYSSEHVEGDGPEPTAPSESDSASPDTSDFSEATIERARSTGMEARRAVVQVSFSGGGGTGWVLDAEAGYVVTNSHVVRENSSVSIETFDGDVGRAERVGYHRDLIPDIALLQTDLDGLSALPTGDRSTLEAGDPVLAIGHPGSTGEWIVTLGRYRRYEPGQDWLMSSVPTDQGNSGGPLVTLDGEVVGVVSGSASRGGGPQYSKPDEVFTELPEPEKLTTATSIETLRRWVDEWT